MKLFGLGLSTLVFLVGCGSTVTEAPAGSASSSSSSSSASASASSSSSASVAASTGSGGSGAGGESGAGGAETIPFECQGIEALVLETPVVYSDGPDGAWLAGESATPTVTLHNTSSEIFSKYPGVAFAADNPLVTSSNPDAEGAFGIAGGDSFEQSAVFVADPSIPAGTKIHFTATVNTIHTSCPNAMSVGFDVTIQGIAP